MITKTLLYIKQKLPIIWIIIYNINNLLIKVLHNKKINTIKNDLTHPKLIDPSTYYQLLTIDHIKDLSVFLNSLDNNDLIYFSPHSFKNKPLKKILNSYSFIPIGLYYKKSLIGYFFLRLFVNKRCFLGNIIHPNFQRKGYGKATSQIFKKLATKLDFSLFATIHKDNQSSLKCHSPIVKIKNLANNYSLYQIVLSQKDRYKLILANYLQSNPQIFLFFKGRTALYALLKAIHIQQDDEIILPAFTCVVVPNAILYLKAKPIYVDITPDTYTIDIFKIESKITPKTKVILIQNTFGLSVDIEKIITLAKKHNLITIEDCTHGFGGTYNTHPNGTLCDAAFFSTQWNKSFSTGIGGFALINNPNLVVPMKHLEQTAHLPSFKQTLSLQLQLLAYRYLINDWSYWKLRRLYRLLSKYNIITGSSQGEELTSIHMPKTYFQKMSKVQIKAGIQALHTFNILQITRKENGIRYTNFLKQYNKNHVPERLHANHSFLTYPLLVTNRPQFMALAEKANIKLGDWFVSPIHPITTHFDQWKINPTKYPQSIRISSHIVNLPTTLKNPNNLLVFLKKNLPYIKSTHTP